MGATSTVGGGGAAPRPFRTRTRVRYAETDQMGVVYHAHYLVWCEIGRTEMIRALGRSYADLERSGVYLAVADASIRYRAAARYDDRIEITTRVERIQSRALTFGYTLERIEPGPRTSIATARTRLVVLDPSGAPTTLPPEVADLFRGVAVREP